MARGEIFKGPRKEGETVSGGGPVTVAHGAAEQALAFGVPAEDITVEVAPGLEVSLAVARALEAQQNKS